MGLYYSQLRSLRSAGMVTKGFSGGSGCKESVCNAGDPGLIPGIPWRRKWQPTPVFLPGKSHGWRSLVDNTPWGCKESDTTERLTHKSSWGDSGHSI